MFGIELMKVSKYIFILLGIALIIIGLFLGYNGAIFGNHKETVGYTGLLLYVLGIFVFLFQFVVWFIWLLIAIFKEMRK